MPDQIIFRGAYVRRFSVGSSSGGESIVLREDFETMKRELGQFARRWKELYG